MVLFHRKFLQWLGGGLLAGLIDVGLEMWAEGPPAQPWHGKALGNIEPLPPPDRWATLGISAIPWLLGTYMRMEAVKNVGQGMMLYSVPMILARTIVRAAELAGRASPTSPTYVPVRGSQWRYEVVKR